MIVEIKTAHLKASLCSAELGQTDTSLCGIDSQLFAGSRNKAMVMGFGWLFLSELRGDALLILLVWRRNGGDELLQMSDVLIYDRWRRTLVKSEILVSERRIWNQIFCWRS